MREVKKRKDKVAIALVLCFCVVALTSVFAVRSGLDKIKSNPGSMEISNNAETPAEKDSQVSKQTPVVDSENSTESQKSTDQQEKAASHFVPYIMPVEGNIILEYSMDMPIYSKTLDQYMTHPGIDIKADMSTEVKAVADGTVTKVAQNDRYGMSVEIDHGNGIISVYSNLAETDLAESGDVVKQGDKIGITGETALFESLEAPHLHFEMTKDSAYIDPTEYLKKQQ